MSAAAAAIAWYSASVEERTTRFALLKAGLMKNGESIWGLRKKVVVIVSLDLNTEKCMSVA
ncbi:hypothetical protein KFK09_007011 [Dendrobium nobile]|uniref:Uncharacterized protein n=1 Tax=Dendrobium nobile TaxID=94219 RepID=A0A8T3BSW7_DENNO|nr:hypothetical protein KFK09_007011 [Dendrobium nobile]